MTIDEIRDVYGAEPFQPFTICLDDGREIEITDRMHLALDPTGRTIAVALPDETVDIVDVTCVTRVEENGKQPDD